MKNEPGVKPPPERIRLSAFKVKIYARLRVEKENSLIRLGCFGELY